MTTITPRALAYARRMDALAEQEFGDAYTLKTTFWNDGDFRIVAYNLKDTEMPENTFIELWYQDQQFDHDDAALKLQTASSEANKPRDDTRQYQIGPSEWVELPEVADE